MQEDSFSPAALLCCVDLLEQVTCRPKPWATPPNAWVTHAPQI